MVDPAEITQALKAGELTSQPPDYTMHLGCCCTPAEREVVELCLCLGFTRMETAQMLGKSILTINKRLARFRRKMRKCQIFPEFR